MSNDILIGSYIHLYNKKLGYLDTCGWVKDEPHFVQYPGKAMVRTASVANRDNGSGTWKVVSAAGKADGEPVYHTDQIRLLNCYPGLGYLALFDEVSDDDTTKLITMSPNYFRGRYVLTVNPLSGSFGELDGPATFRFSPTPRPYYPTPIPITENSEVVPWVSLNGRDYTLQGFGPSDKLGMLNFRAPEETGLVFTSPQFSPLPDADYQLWTISLSDCRNSVCQ